MTMLAIPRLSQRAGLMYPTFRLQAQLDGMLATVASGDAQGTRPFIEWSRKEPQQSLECMAERLLTLQTQARLLPRVDRYLRWGMCGGTRAPLNQCHILMALE